MNKAALFIALVVLLSACAPSEQDIQTVIVQTQQAIPTNTPVPPTNTPTPMPTNTSTPAPTNTPAAKFSPYINTKLNINFPVLELDVLQLIVDKSLEQCEGECASPIVKSDKVPENFMPIKATVGGEDVWYRGRVYSCNKDEIATELNAFPTMCGDNCTGFLYIREEKDYFDKWFIEVGEGYYIFVTTFENIPPNSKRLCDTIYSTASLLKSYHHKRYFDFIPVNTDLVLSISEPKFLITKLQLQGSGNIIYRGAGDSVIDLDKIGKREGPALLQATYNGGGNFSVVSYGENNEYYDLLINTTGTYSGTRLLDFLDDKHTVRLEVSADAGWEIRIFPFANILVEYPPSLISGRGNAVITLKGDAPDLLKADASTITRSFVVRAWSATGSDLLINEIGPYTGTVMLPTETTVLTIETDGDWTLEVTTK